MRALLPALLAATLLVAGCAQKSADNTSTTAASSTTGKATTTGATGTGTATASGTTTASRTSTATTTATGTGGPGNHAPTATLAFAGNHTGAAPLNVTFAANATDPDGDALALALSFGDGTTPLTGNATRAATHRYTAAGNYTVRFTASDGKATANATLLVTVTGGAGGSGGGFAPIAQDLDVAILCEVCTDIPTGATPAACISLNLGVPGADCTWLELPASAAGHTFTIVGAPATLFADPEMAQTATCSADADVLAAGGSSTEDTENGTILAGAGCLVIWDYAGTGPVTFHVTVA